MGKQASERIGGRKIRWASRPVDELEEERLDGQAGQWTNSRKKVSLLAPDKSSVAAQLSSGNSCTRAVECQSA